MHSSGTAPLLLKQKQNGLYIIKSFKWYLYVLKVRNQWFPVLLCCGGSWEEPTFLLYIAEFLSIVASDMWLDFGSGYQESNSGSHACHIGTGLLSYIPDHGFFFLKLSCLTWFLLISEFLGKTPGQNAQKWIPARSTRRDDNSAANNSANEKERHDAIFRKVRG